MTKKSCIIFGNCQGYAISEFLKFSNFYDIYDVNTYANWEMIKNNESIPIRYMTVKINNIQFQDILSIILVSNIQKMNTQMQMNFINPILFNIFYKINKYCICFL
jgi:hypothetical protein